MYEKVLMFEAGKLEKTELLALFEELVKTGDIWKYPTNYVDNAASLIDSNLIGDRKKKGMQ